MILQVLTVRDSAVEAYGQPFYSVSVGGAVRGFTDEINRADAGNNMAKHPDDFELYHLGTFDDVDASFNLNAPRLVSRGKDVKK